jgi:hypothetical protein
MRLPELPTNMEIHIQLVGTNPARRSASLEERVEAFLQAARLPTAVKWMFSRRLSEFLQHPAHLLEIWQYFSPAQTLALLELIFGKQKEPIPTDPEAALTNALGKAQKWMASRD